ncbi:hypothetical protein CH289_07765 [Rhodococcus sp. RS1C4]|nr:hypothetical protein CH289_07765 [Rhodococcus sp. RS1C4]
MTVQEAIDAKQLNPDEPWGMGYTYKEALDKWGTAVGEQKWVREEKKVQGLGGVVVEQVQGAAALAALNRLEAFADLRVDLLSGHKDSEAYLPAYIEAETFAGLIRQELDTLTPKDDA